MSSKQQRRSFWEGAIDVSRSRETTPTVVHTLRVYLNDQNKPLMQNWNDANAIYVTLSTQLCKTFVDKKVTLFLYISKSFDDSTAIAFHMQFISPLHNCAPPFAFICASIQSLEREETFTITHSYAPFLQVFLYVFFTFSSVQYWAPTYGKTHCCTPPEVPPAEYKRVKEKKC